MDERLRSCPVIRDPKTIVAARDSDAWHVPTTNMVLHIPHDSTRIPADVRHTLRLSDDALQTELIAMTDSFTAELFAFASDVPRVTFPVSRLIVDPEGSVDDAHDPMAARGMGVVYTATSDGAVLRSQPTSSAREALRRSPHLRSNHFVSG